MFIAFEFMLGVFLSALNLPTLVWVGCVVESGIPVYHRWLFAIGVTLMAHAYFIGKL